MLRGFALGFLAAVILGVAAAELEDALERRRIKRRWLANFRGPAPAPDLA
jgi:predicted PurR-regulated permease PerM